MLAVIAVAACSGDWREGQEVEPEAQPAARATADTRVRSQADATAIITTNVAFKQWGNTFPGAACVVALVDRFAQHCHRIEIVGESWRDKHRLDSDRPPPKPSDHAASAREPSDVESRWRTRAVNNGMTALMRALNEHENATGVAPRKRAAA